MASQSLLALHLTILHKLCLSLSNCSKCLHFSKLFLPSLPVFPPPICPIFPPTFPRSVSLFLSRGFPASHFFPNNPHLAILQRLLWSAGVRMGARREDKKILPIGEEDHLHCTHTPAPDIRGKTGRHRERKSTQYSACDYKTGDASGYEKGGTGRAEVGRH